MLVLSRKKREKVMVRIPAELMTGADREGAGLEIEIFVAEIRRESVRLGFTAPACIAIHREEVAAAIRRGSQRSEVSSQRSEVSGRKPETEVQATDLRPPTSDLRPPATDLRPLTSGTEVQP